MTEYDCRSTYEHEEQDESALKTELIECVQAALSFIEDQSLSGRRRQACLSAFRAVLAKCK